MTDAGALDYLSLATAISIILAGIVEAFRRAGLQEKWAPFAAMGVGIVLAFLVDAARNSFASGSIAQNILAGIVAGLAATGLYSGVTKLAKPEDRSTP